MSEEPANVGEAVIAERRLNMIEAINEALDIMLERDPDVIIMGEDVGYFGGVFRATAGLQKKFGKARVVEPRLTRRDLGKDKRARNCVLSLEPHQKFFEQHIVVCRHKFSEFLLSIDEGACKRWCS